MSGNFLTANNTIILIITVVYILQHLIMSTFGLDAHNMIFVLEPDNLLRVWTWLTHMVSHSPVVYVHFIFNVLALVFFGPVVEDMMGSKEYVIFFVMAGIIAGFTQIAYVMLIGTDIGLLGVSGVLFGLLGFLTIQSPKSKILLFFIIPMPMYVFTILTVVFSVLSLYFGVFSLVGHGAHLGGLFFGILYGVFNKERMTTPDYL